MNRYLPFIPVVFYLVSCAPIDNVVPENPDNPISVIQESSEMFPLTATPGIYNFYTNDSAFIKQYGMTFWTSKLPDQTPFSQIDISLYKVSGNELAGYGMVFCHDLRSDPLVETMLIFMINLNREFIIGKVINDTFSVLIPWTHSDLINPGFNQENRINITFDSSTEKFLVEINGQYQTSFEDNDEPVHRSGSSGFISVISPFDKFPEKPVQILYKQN